MTHDLAGRAGLLKILSWARPHDSATEPASRCVNHADTSDLAAEGARLLLIVPNW